MIVTLGSPVVITEFAPQFDALVFEALRQKYCQLSDEECLNKMKKILLFNNELGVFHASSMRFTVSPEHGVIAQEYIRIDYLKDKLSSDMFAPNGRKGNYVGIPTAGGPTKKRLTTRLSYNAKYCIFDAVGDKEAISVLLNNTHFGIGYDANCGCGEVIDLDFITLDDDVSIQCQGAARRNVPIGSSLKGIESNSRLIPPYYLKDLQQATISAERIVSIPHSQVLLAK